MCKWCARQCRPHRHQSSVRAQLRPRSPHVRRQNPDPRHRKRGTENARGTYAGHVCEVARVGARGGACTCERQRQTCVCIWALGSRGALGPRTCVSRFSFHCAPCTQGVRRRALAWGITREDTERALRTIPSAPRRLSALTLFGSLPWRRLPNNSAAERQMSGQCTIGRKHQVCLVCCDSFAQHAIAPRQLMRRAACG